MAQAIYRMTDAEWAEVKDWFHETHWQREEDGMLTVAVMGHPGMLHNLEMKLGEDRRVKLKGEDVRHPLLRMW